MVKSKKDKKVKQSNDTVGIFYERPDGRIAHTYGFNNHNKTVSYYLEGERGKTVSQKEFQEWKPRRDLRDFPNAKDPKLPYVFDLLWDIKYTSDLMRVLDQGHPDIKDIRAEMVKIGLSFNV